MANKHLVVISLFGSASAQSEQMGVGMSDRRELVKNFVHVGRVLTLLTKLALEPPRACHDALASCLTDGKKVKPCLTPMP